MQSKIDYVEVLLHGVGILRPEQLRRFIGEISRLRLKDDSNQNLGGEAQENILQEAIHDVIVDILNLATPTRGRNSLRTRILEQARGSSDPDGVCRREFQRLVQREVTRRAFTSQQRQIYRQVAKAVLELETKGIVQSNMPSRKRWITRLILEHRKHGDSPLSIAQELNQRGLRTDDGDEWTSDEVSEILMECGGPLKKVGLKSWGKGWLRRIQRASHRCLVEGMDPIPLYVNEDLQSPRHQPKLFDHRLLRGVVLRLLEISDSALTIGQMTRVIEDKFVPPPYRTDREMGLYSPSPDDDEAEVRKPAPIEVIADVDSCCEETLIAAQMEHRLTECLDPSELEIFAGRLKGQSLREIAYRLGVSLGTVANRMRTIRNKATKLGLEVDTFKTKRGLMNQ